MTKQEIISRLEACINALRDVDIPQRLMNTSGRTIQNVNTILMETGRAIADMDVVEKPKAESEKTEGNSNA